MTNNANIQARFIDLLNVLDARAVVTVFELQENEKQILRFDCVPVWQILSAFPDDKETNALKRYDVIGLNVGMNTNILIKKEGV